jgi:hypothetical protein
MDRPLWQILFNIALIGFVVRRAALGLALQTDRTPAALWGVYVALIAVCALASIAILFSRRWVFGGVIAMLAVYTVATFVEIGVGSIAPPVWLIGQLVIAVAFSAVILWWARSSNAGDTAS